MNLFYFHFDPSVVSSLRRTLVTSMVQEWRVREARAGQRSLTASTVAAVSCSAGSQLARTDRSVYRVSIECL